MASSQLVLRPPNADRTGIGLFISLLAHAALVAALTLGVRWHTEAPAAVEAELWAAVPQIAAPPAPPPEPEPPAPEVTPPTPAAPEPDPAVVEREADIALEKARVEEQAQKEREALEAEKARELELRQRKVERDKKLALDRKAEKERKAEADAAELAAQLKKEELAKRQALAKKEKAEDAKREAIRQEQIARMSAQLSTTTSGNGNSTSTGTAVRSAGPSAGYGGRIKAAIKPNIVFPPAIAGNPEAEVEVRTGPDGTVFSRRISKSSGNRDWDEAVLKAIDKTARLPKDIDGHVEPVLLITFRPNE
jgi:colicin import membrane protein